MKRIRSMKKLLISIVKPLTYGMVFGLIITSPSSAFQAIPTVSLAQAANCDVGWDQSGNSLAEVQAFKYEYFADGSINPVLAPTTCNGTQSPYLCKTPLPVKTIGTHTVTIKNSVLLSDGTYLDGGVSSLFTYRIVNPPIAPANLRLILN